MNKQRERIWILEERWVRGKSIVDEQEYTEELFRGSREDCIEEGHRLLLDLGFEVGDIGNFVDDEEFTFEDGHYLEFGWDWQKDEDHVHHHHRQN